MKLAGSASVPNQLVWLLVTLSWSDTTWFPVFLRSRDSLLQLKLTQQVLSNPSFSAPTRLELVLTCMVQLLQEPSTYPDPHSMVEDCHAMAVCVAMRRVTLPRAGGLVTHPLGGACSRVHNLLRESTVPPRYTASAATRRTAMALLETSICSSPRLDLGEAALGLLGVLRRLDKGESHHRGIGWLALGCGLDRS